MRALIWGRGVRRRLWLGAVVLWSGIAVVDAAPPVAVLRASLDALAHASTDSERLSAHAALAATWRDWLAAVPAEEAWNFELAPFEGWMAVIEGGEGDDRIRTITWNVELTDRTNRYGGFLIHADGWTELVQDQRLDNADVLDVQRRYKPEDWPGAIYYDIVVRRDRRRRPVYLLLGWQGADATTSRKVVETLSLQRGRPRFGAPTLVVEGRRVKRHHLVYGDVLSAVLRHEPDRDRIVMDHLSTASPELEGMFAYYGPDYTYDAFVWSKGDWVLEKNVEVANPKNDAPWRDPKPRGRRGRNRRSP